MARAGRNGKRKASLGRYRSGLEQRLFEGPLKGVPYEEKKFKYRVEEEKTYTPDGWLHDKVWLELKGRFRTMDEAKKYLHIQKCYPDVYIVFVLGGHYVPLPGAQFRKKTRDRRTHEDWLKSNGFLYCYESTIDTFLTEVYPSLIVDENELVPTIKEVTWRKKSAKS